MTGRWQGGILWRRYAFIRRKMVQTGDNEYRLYTTETTVRLTSHLERVGILAAAIRARLQGTPVATEAPGDKPSPEQVAAWLRVSVEELPLVFHGLGDWEVLVVSTLTVAAFLITWFLGLNLGLVVILWWVLWGHFLAHPLPIRVEMGVEGVKVVDLFGRSKTGAWMDLYRLRGRSLPGRYGALIIPRAIEKEGQLFFLLRRALAQRGGVSSEEFSPSVLISEAALSRAPSPGGSPTVTDLSLSKSPSREKEATPHLTAPVSEQQEEYEDRLASS